MRFARPLSQLTEVLRVDLQWIREHTGLGDRDALGQARTVLRPTVANPAMEAWSLYQYSKEFRALGALAREGLRKSSRSPAAKDTCCSMLCCSPRTLAVCL